MRKQPVRRRQAYRKTGGRCDGGRVPSQPSTGQPSRARHWPGRAQDPAMRHRARPRQCVLRSGFFRCRSCGEIAALMRNGSSGRLWSSLRFDGGLALQQHGPRTVRAAMTQWHGSAPLASERSGKCTWSAGFAHWRFRLCAELYWVESPSEPMGPFVSTCPTSCLVNGLSGSGRASPLRGLGRNSANAPIFRRALARSLHRETK